MKEDQSAPCTCWQVKGVLRKEHAVYVCAGCGHDVSHPFMRLIHADEVWADRLIDIGHSAEAANEAIPELAC